MKRAVVLAILVLIVCASTFAGGGKEAVKAKELNFVIMAKGVHPWFEPGGEGFAAAAQEIGGIKARYMAPPTFSSEAQTKMLEDLIAEGVNGIAMSVFDVAALTPVINEAMSRGIAIATWDADAEGSKRIFFSGTANFEAGKMQGEEFARMSGGNAKFVIFCQELTSANIKQRIAGIRSVTKNYPGLIEVTDEQPYYNDMGKALVLAENLLVAYPNLNAALDVGVEGVAAMYKTLKEKNVPPGKYLLIDWTVLPDVVQGVKDGYINGTYEQNPYAMGYLSCYALKYYVDGKRPTQQFFNTGITFLNKDNVDTIGEINKKTSKPMLEEFKKLWK